MSVRTDEVIERLRTAILTGELAPGSRLQEVEVADELGVSRTPVREALRVLSSQGLVQILPNRGASVAEWSRGDLEEIYDLRQMLESHAAARAATRLSDTDLATMEELCDAMEECAAGRSTQDMLRLTELNSAFHSMVFAAAGSDRLSRLNAGVVQVPLVFGTFSRYSPAALARSMAHHRELVEASRAKSPEWAASVMRSHILAASVALLESDPPLPRGAHRTVFEERDDQRINREHDSPG